MRVDVSLLRQYKFQLFAPKCNLSAEHVNCLAALLDAGPDVPGDWL